MSEHDQQLLMVTQHPPALRGENSYCTSSAATASLSPSPWPIFNAYNPSLTPSPAGLAANQKIALRVLPTAPLQFNAGLRRVEFGQA